MAGREVASFGINDQFMEPESDLGMVQESGRYALCPIALGGNWSKFPAALAGAKD